MAEMSAKEAAERLKFMAKRYTDKPEIRRTLLCAATLCRKVAAGALREVVHGRWQEYSGADKGFHFCSNCEAQAFNFDDEGLPVEILSEHCYRCGALMDEKEDSHE